MVTGPASRSNTAEEYSVSRLARITVCLSIAMNSRMWWNLPVPPAWLMETAKYLSVSARLKLSAVTSFVIVMARSCRLDVRQLPGFVEHRFVGSVESEERD